MSARPVRSFLQRQLAPRLLAALLRGLRLTWRLRWDRRERLADAAGGDQRSIVVLWHAHLLAAFYCYVGPGWRFLVSRHRDGEMIARVGLRFGYQSLRGSSTHGGAEVLRDAVRALRAGLDLGITPDGPRGPARIVQPGCVAAARLGRARIVPVALAASRGWTTRSWDRMLIPKPFSTVVIHYGEPIEILPDVPIDVAQQRVQQALESAAGTAAALLDRDANLSASAGGR